MRCRGWFFLRGGIGYSAVQPSPASRRMQSTCPTAGSPLVPSERGTVRRAEWRGHRWVAGATQSKGDEGKGVVRRYGLYILCLALLGAFLVWPVVLTLSAGLQDVAPDGSTTWTLRHVLGVFRDPKLTDALINSTAVGAAVTLLSLAIALPLAVIHTRYEFPGKALFTGLVLVPLILPPFVGAIGMRALLGRYGAINSLLASLGLVDPAAPIDFLGSARFVGVVLMEALHLYPIVYLNVTAALANLDPALEQAADNLGASRWTRFRRITLPLIMPGIFAGCTIVFIWAFSELGTPLMFDYYEVAPVQIFWGVQEMAASPRPYALVIVMLTLAVGLYGLGKVLLGGRAHAMSTRAMTTAVTRRLRPRTAALAALPFAAVTLLAVLPHIGVLLASFAEPGSWYRSVLPARWTTHHYAGALTHSLAAGAIRNSLLYSSLAVVVDLFLGLAIAYLIVRGKVRGRRLLDGLAMLPLAVPGLVLAFGYVAMTLHWPFPQLADYFAEKGWEGLAAMCSVTGEAPNPIVFLVIAYGVRRLPYIVRAAAAGLEQTSGDLEDAAANLGAPPLYTIRRIVVPLIMANLIAGALLTFSFAMLEVSDSLMLAQKTEDYPITKAIFVLFQLLGEGKYVASSLGVWAMAFLTMTILAVSLLLGRKMGAIFRV